VKRALILSRGDRLRFPELGTGVQLSESQYPARKAQSVLTMDQAIANHIRLVLEQVCGRFKGKGGAAEALNMNPSTLRFRMKKLGIRSKGT